MGEDNSLIGLGLVTNMQRYSVQDGPGIRTTIFFKGCPLRCLWCANPEAQNVFPELAIINRLCNKCGHCVEACEMNAISLIDEGVAIDRLKCTNCGKCIDTCTLRALKIFGEQISIEDALREVKKDEIYYRNSGGGVTISGGEPLLQVNFLVPFLKRCQDEGRHVTLDTCGYASPQTLKMVLPYISFVLYDLKHMDTIVHKEVTQVSNELILNNLKLIVTERVPTIVRVAVIPGINDSEKNTRETVAFVTSLGKIEQIDLLPYHKWGINKYEMLGRVYPLANLAPPSHEQVEYLKGIVESSGLRCEIGG